MKYSKEDSLRSLLRLAIATKSNSLLKSVERESSVQNIEILKNVNTLLSHLVDGTVRNLQLKDTRFEFEVKLIYRMVIFSLYKVNTPVGIDLPRVDYEIFAGNYEIPNQMEVNTIMTYFKENSLANKYLITVANSNAWIYKELDKSEVLTGKEDLATYLEQTGLSNGNYIAVFEGLSR